MKQTPNRQEHKTPVTTGNAAWSNVGPSCKMYIMRGVPGSGKSTRAHAIRIKHTNEGLRSVVCSTDDYWIRPDETYDFNAKLIGRAHHWNQRRCYDACRDGLPVVIVDNTNTRLWEMKQYRSMAEKFGYEVEIVSVHDSNLSDEQIKLFAERNTHGVPLENIRKMAERFEDVS